MQAYDVVVVGAGIQGAAVAQAVAARGWSVLVLEQYDQVARGTSSRSSKLIHGGLRYLETGQFSLVRQCLNERQLLLRNAPELVKMRAFYIPIYKSTRRRPWQIHIGLSLYALLGGFGKPCRYVRVPRQQWGELDGLDHDGLQAVFKYHDAQTDDAALTAAVVGTSQSLGAALSLSSRLVGAELQRDAVAITYQRNGESVSCRAKVLINAAGPWVNRVLACVQPAVDPTPIELIQGTHIVLPQPTRRGIYYLEAPSDGRAVFVMPWRDQTLIGTTETRFEGNPAKVAPQEEEVRYLLKTYSHYFQTTRFGIQDVVEAFAGLRVLPAGSGPAFWRAREMCLHTDRDQRPRVVSIYGGKLTAYRAMAQRVARRIAPSLPPAPKPHADTRQLRLLPV